MNTTMNKNIHYDILYAYTLPFHRMNSKKKLMLLYTSKLYKAMGFQSEMNTSLFIHFWKHKKIKMFIKMNG